LLVPCLYILRYTEIWSIRFVGSLSIYFAVHRDLIHQICWFLVYIFCSTQRFDPSDLLVPCIYILRYTEIWSIRFVGSLSIYFAVHRDLIHPICWFLVYIFCGTQRFDPSDLLVPCIYILQYTEIWSIRFVGWYLDEISQVTDFYYWFKVILGKILKYLVHRNHHHEL